MLTEDVEKLQGSLTLARINVSKQKAQIKRMRLLVNYILAVMSEEDFDSDPAIQKAFDKCDKAGDLG